MEKICRNFGRIRSDYHIINPNNLEVKMFTRLSVGVDDCPCFSTFLMQSLRAKVASLSVAAINNKSLYSMTAEQFSRP